MAKWRLAKALGVDLRLNTLNLLLAQSFRSSFVLADTSQLHTKITEMGQRIRQLEDALAISHSGISNEPHPLLRDELLSIKFGPENGTTSRAPPSRDPSVESIDAFGTLTIFDRDLSKYFGRSAGSEKQTAKKQWTYSFPIFLSNLEHGHFVKLIWSKEHGNSSQFDAMNLLMTYSYLYIDPEKKELPLTRINPMSYLPTGWLLYISSSL
ncbi:hypothetical protein HHX47_DHR5000208 [Lentinula edodes]|nr:hypothetical protein HHX47_DHR5000208 [Lentinula edodes]